uniref:Uncharacterized protein n=2 Tax=Magallana gigas TaxID=29159 RepID=A0A8W8IX46_MAGGI
MDFYSLDNDWKGKGRKYNNVSDTSLHEFSDLNKRDELKENRESNKECEDVKPEFTECSTKDGPYNVPIKDENYMSSEYSISSKYRKQTKYKKIVLTVLFISCLITLAVAGAVIFGNSTHNRQNLNENFPENETTFGKNLSSMEIPTPTIDPTTKHTTDNIDLTMTSRKSKTSEGISSSMSFLFTTLSKSKPSTSNSPETSLPNFSPSVSTNMNTSTNDLSPSSGPSMTTSQSKSPIQPSLTTRKFESPSKGISTSASSITQTLVTTDESESPSNGISSSVHSTTSTTIHPSVTISQYSHSSERTSTTTSSVPSSITKITYPSMTSSKSKPPSERISSTSSSTSPSITEQQQLSTNIATTIVKQTTAFNDTRFVSTTPSTKAASTIFTTDKQFLTSSRNIIYSTTQLQSTHTRTTSVSKTHPSVLTTIIVPSPDEQKIPELISTKTSSQTTTSVTTFVTP